MIPGQAQGGVPQGVVAIVPQDLPEIGHHEKKAHIQFQEVVTKRLATAQVPAAQRTAVRTMQLQLADIG